MDLLCTDKGLAIGYKQGVEAALARVYSEYVDDVWRAVRGAGITDPDTQADIVQETFLKVFAPQAREAYDPSREFKPFVCSIARNIAVDWLRRAGTRIKVKAVLTNETELTPLPGSSPEQEIHRKRLKELVQDYIDSLNPEEFEFWRLRYRDELGQEEVSRRMGVTRRRVRTLEHRLRKGLRRVLFSNGIKELEKY